MCVHNARMEVVIIIWHDLLCSVLLIEVCISVVLCIHVSVLTSIICFKHHCLQATCTCVC